MEQVKSWNFYRAVVIQTLVFAVVFIAPAFVPRTVSAQSALEPTQIVIGAPAQASAGEQLTVQAMLVDSQGKPIAMKTIYFTTQATFLTGSGEVVLAQAVTNKNGQAVAHFADDLSGAINLRAEFRGDKQYAASNAAAQIGAAGEGQVYAEHIGVSIPGFNVPPVVGGPAASLDWSAQGFPGTLARMWPAMTGWPIAVALIIVWALYFRAVTLIYRIASPGSETGEATPTAGRRRSL